MVTLTHSTESQSAKTIQRNWHLIDVKEKILGRTVAEVVSYLMGKHKANYAPYLDMGDYVVIINAKNVRLSGKKEKTKTYSKFSGYPGGLSVVSFQQLMLKNPVEIVRHAVAGMLPKNKLRDKRLGRLKIYPNDVHPYGAKLK